MTDELEPLRSHMREPELTRPQALELWQAVASDSSKPRTRTWIWLGAPAALAAAAAVALVVARPEDRQVSDAGTLRVPPAVGPLAPATVERTTILADGSRVIAAAGSTVRTLESNPRHVRLRLESGSVELEVVPDAERIFAVHAGDYEITVVGTRFVVAFTKSTDEPRLLVSVKSGTVRVARAGDLVAVLQQGDIWTEQDGTSPSNPRSASLPPGVEPSTATAPAAKDPASQLFDRAGQARLAGKMGEAAGLFDQVRKKYPRHALAGLAAFELGRIRLDNLRDPAGAVEALTSALALAPGAPFREDVEARRIQALDAMGASDACRAGKDAYLKRYPNGPHAAQVLRRCDSN